MALSTPTSRIQYAGNSATTVFSFPYYFLANADLVVIITSSAGVETIKTITTHYTITGAGVAAGGSVTMLTAPATGETLTIYRDPAITQGVDLVENDSLPAESVEAALDRITMIAQRLDSQIENVVKLSNGFVGTFDTTLPTDLAGVVSSALVTNATGDGWADAADWPSATDIAAASANAVAAAASAVAAAASAVTAAASAASVLAQLPFTDISYKVFADSPIAPVTGNSGTLFSIDCTSGAVVVNLPAISTMIAEAPLLIFKNTDSTVNKVTINRGSTDTIEGSTSITLDVQGAGVILIADTDKSPDAWGKMDFGASSSSGGGGGSLEWTEPANAPIKTTLAYMPVYEFTATLAQQLYVVLNVPTSYVTGRAITLKLKSFNEDTSGTVLLLTTTTLIRSEVDDYDDTTNTRVSTNSAITMSAANDKEPQKLSFDITSATGTVNSVSVSAGDILLVRLYRDTDTATGPIYTILGSEEVTFT